MALEAELFTAHLRSDLVNPPGVPLYFGLQTVESVSCSEVQWVNVSLLGPQREGTEKCLMKVRADGTSGPSRRLAFARGSEVQLLAGCLKMSVCTFSSLVSLKICLSSL